MKLLYKPIGILFGFIAARIAKAVFTAIWTRIDDHEPPEPTAEHTTFPKVIAAHSIEAATKAGVKAASDRLAATVFHYLTGAWPGKDPEPAE